jgi:DNA (cytosine-5)-methyltransferase 1
MNQRKLKVLDLFSGIGGFALGLDSTGIFETVKFVEKDKYCQKVLQKNFPNIPIEEDIKNVEGKEGDADVVVGGFPCQPMSVAGKRKGTDDDRYLWPEMFRLIKQIKPQFVIGENVQGIINIQNGMVLRQVQDDLESEGFEVQCFLIPASGIGAWHQRYRVWIVGHSEHNGSLASKIERRNTETATGTQEGTNTTGEPERTSGSRNNENVSNTEIIGTGEPRNINQEEGNQSSSSTQSNSSSEDVSNTDSGMRRRWRTIGESGEDKVWRFYPEKEEQTRVDIRSETIGRDVVSGEETNALQSDDERREERDVSDQSEEQNIDSGRHDTNEQEQTWWQVESAVRGIPNGISYELDKDRANRIKTLGNAIVPQIARELGLAIKKVLYDHTDV